MLVQCSSGHGSHVHGMEILVTVVVPNIVLDMYRWAIAGHMSLTMAVWGLCTDAGALDSFHAVVLKA